MDGCEIEEDDGWDGMGCGRERKKGFECCELLGCCSVNGG